MKKEKIILSVKNLSVSFDGKEKILDDVNFEVREGENLIIMGPNGAGKSVLLKTLLGLIPHSGEIKWKDKVKIGYVPQRFAPEKKFPLNVEEFFKFKEITKEKIMEALASVGLNDEVILKRTIGEISSGQMQRVLIAWSLVSDPDILLFDEPTAGIDIGGEETVYKLLGNIEKEKDLTIIFVTHDLSIIHKLADSVLCLNKKMVCYGGLEELGESEVFEKLYGHEVKVYKHTHDREPISK